MGAAVSERPWPGVDARLSRYSYLVSLLPAFMAGELGVELPLRRRAVSSYTPRPDGTGWVSVGNTRRPTREVMA